MEAARDCERRLQRLHRNGPCNINRPPRNNAALPRVRPLNGRKARQMFKFLGGAVGFIFLVGLIVVIGILALIF